MTPPADKKRARKKPVEIRQWSESELKNLIAAYKKGQSRYKIGLALGRTNGSVANKIRLLVQAGLLSPRK